MSVIGGLLSRWLQLALALMRQVIVGLVGGPIATLTQPLDIAPSTVARIIGVRHAVLRAGLPESTAHFDGDDDPHTRHWAVTRAGVVIACATVVSKALPVPCSAPSPPLRQLRGMAVLPEYRGQGIGAALLAAIIADEQGPLWCNAREAAVAFYRQQGWSPIGERFDIAPIGPHLRMTSPQ